MSQASVYFDGEDVVYKADVLDKHAPGYATFNDTLSKIGWGILDISSSYSSSVSDEQVYYAAGYLEGSLTYRYVFFFYLNPN